MADWCGYPASGGTMSPQKVGRARQVGSGQAIGRAGRHPVTRSKFGVRTDAAGKLARTCDGILFDSAAECKRYGELRLLEKAGHIRELWLQPKFPLHAPSSGFVRQIGVVRLDFMYHTPTGDVVFEDVKGGPTLALAKWKFKHFEAQYGIKVTEVRYR